MNPSPSKGSLPPWINPAMQAGIAWRDRDIAIAVPPKSGTTWTMNIVYQLLSGGQAEFEDIYAEVPWIEFVSRPGMPAGELMARLEAMPTAQPRAFKTHSDPTTLGYLPPGGEKDVRYVVVMRNPEEALVSMQPFIAQHTDEWFALWQAPRAAFEYPDFPRFYAGFVEKTQMHRGIFEFLNGWWPLRHAPNVLFVHFGDMKRDLDAATRRIAEFLSLSPSPAEWARISEYTSFDWMKRHDIKFDGVTLSAVPLMNPGSMVRRGHAGGAKEDGMTATLAGELRALGEALCQDTAALRWLYQGGPIA